MPNLQLKRSTVLDPVEPAVDDELIELKKLVKSAMIRDQFRLSNQVRRFQDSRQHKHSSAKAVASLAADVKKSVELRNLRAVNLPTPIVDTELPIFERQQEICDAMVQNQVVVISGATGSGKSTQLPLMALLAGFGIAGMIGHTQPRPLL